MDDSMLVDHGQMMVPMSQMPQKEITPDHLRVQEQISKGVIAAVQELKQQAQSLQ